MANDNGDIVQCGGCGMSLEDPADLSVENPIPCPRCGSTLRSPRSLTVSVTETVNINEYGAMLHEKDGRAIGFSESPRDGRSTAATLDAETRLKFAVSGSSPQGEEDTLHVCRVLAQRLRKDDARWMDPEPAVGQLDCVIKSSDQQRTLNVQVVRAIVDQSLWRTLNLAGAVSLEVPVTEAVNAIKNAVELKASDRKIPSKDRGAITLALDATRLPGLAFDVVIDQFRADHGSWVTRLGFSAVWLVGPRSSLVWRLDIRAGS
jgi:hypothetical protein